MDSAAAMSACLAVFNRKVGYIVVDGGKFLWRCKKDDPERPICCVAAEARSVDDEHTLGAQQAKHEILVASSRWQRELRHRVERTARCDAPHAGNRVHPRRRQLRAG